MTFYMLRAHKLIVRDNLQLMTVFFALNSLRAHSCYTHAAFYQYMSINLLFNIILYSRRQWLPIYILVQYKVIVL
jgi:hypothetical protein